MTGHVDAERILDAFLAPEHDQLADRVLEAALADIARTPQRRALRVPWRFPHMTPILRIAVLAAVLVAALAGGAFFFAGSGVGPGPAPTPTPTVAPTPTVVPTPSVAPSPAEVAPGISSFTSYTSPIYGLTFGYPDGWTLDGAAERTWQQGDGGDAQAPGRSSDSFMNPEARDGDQIALGVWQRAAGSSADITTLEGLTTWAAANFCDRAIDACDTLSDVAVPMCAGEGACAPAVLLPLSDSTGAVIAHPETGMVTVVSLGRPDAFPAAARYGGAVQLLKSILATLDVRTPQPGEIGPTACREVAPGICGWTRYTSAAYGYTMAYPADWSVHAPAEHKWQPDEPVVQDAWPWADVFANPEKIDGDSMGMWVWQVPAPAGSDLRSWEGLQTAFMDVCESPSFGSCQFERVNTTAPPTRMCRGAKCHPALLVSMGIDEVTPWGVFGDPKTGLLTVFEMGRPDNFPAARRYGGTVALLKSILSQADVRMPHSGETAS